VTDKDHAKAYINLQRRWPQILAEHYPQLGRAFIYEQGDEYWKWETLADILASELGVSAW